MTMDKERRPEADFDIDAREAQVVGNPRIAPLEPEDFSAEAVQFVEENKAIFGASDTAEVPVLYRIMFRHPGLSRAQNQLGIELNKNGTIPPRERELAILRVAWLVRSPFEWGQHVQYGKRYGLTAEEIERITIGSTAPDWGELDRAILSAVEELMNDYAMATETWDLLARTWTDEQLMELPGLVGAYVLTAMIYNTIRFDLLPGNEGMRQR
jgi:alkylhydroperoxidase family enzyme